MRQLHLPMRIWDLPIRLFHWVLVILLAVSWWSAEMLWMRLHMWSGLTVMALLMFRLIWGFIGSDTARFTRFLQSPVKAFHHLLDMRKREPDTEIGHNAAGGWMVLGLLGLLALQIASGLGAQDEGVVEGPLALALGKETSDWLTRLHHLNFKFIQIAVLLHVLAVAAYRLLKGQDLVTPMITGKKRLPGATRAPMMMHPVLGLAVFAVSALAVFVFTRFFPVGG